MTKENICGLKSVDGVLLRVGQKVYQNGKPYTILGFGDGQSRGFLIFKEDKQACNSIIFADKNKSIRDCLKNLYKNRFQQLENQLTILSREIEQVCNLID